MSRFLGRVLALRLIVFGNGFRRPYPAAVRGVGGLVVGIGVVAAAVTLARADGADLVRLSVLGGSAVLALCAFLPAALIRDDPVHPRAFALTGVPLRAVLVLVPVTDVVSVPAVVLAILGAGYVAGWAGADAGGIALVVAVVLVVAGLQLVRLSTAVGARLWTRVHGRYGRAVAVALLLVALIPAATALVGEAAGRVGRLDSAVALVRATGVGLVLDAPASASWLPVIGAIGAVVVLGVIEAFVTRAQYAGPRPRRPRAGIHLGLFRIVQGSPTAAIAVRGLVYWARDPRYGGSLLALPFVPVLMLVAAAIGGVPGVVMALIALPVVVLLIGWAMPHNDTAYDSTAIWTHVVAPLRGAQDRLGRSVPPLLVGGLVTALGALVVWLVLPREGIVPVVLGLCSVSLLGSLGISSAVSARFPYAAPTPGSSAFRAPESPAAGGAVQTISILGSLALTIPAVWAAARWLTEGGAWSWVTLGLGVGVGLAVLVVGVLVGGIGFDRRGPELIEFAVRN